MNNQPTIEYDDVFRALSTPIRQLTRYEALLKLYKWSELHFSDETVRLWEERIDGYCLQIHAIRNVSEAAYQSYIDYSASYLSDKKYGIRTALEDLRLLW